MKVKLFIYSNLKNYVEGYNDNNCIVKELPNRKSIRQFLGETIKLKRAMNGISTIMVNGQVVPFNQLDRYLKDKDVIKVYPPMGGG